MAIRPILSILMKNRTGPILIALQIAITLAILCNTLFISVDRIKQTQAISGVDEANVFFITVSTPGYDKQPFSVQRRDEAILQAIPGVASATWANQIPLDGSGSNRSVGTEQKPDLTSAAYYNSGASLINTLGLRLIDGRDFSTEDYIEWDSRLSNSDPSTVIVTSALAKALYPQAKSVVGLPMHIGKDNPNPPPTIIGVVEQLITPWGRVSWNSDDPEGQRSYIAPVRTEFQGTYLIRTEPGQRANVMKLAEQALKQADSGRIVLVVRDMDQVREQRYANDRYLAGMLLIVIVMLVMMSIAGIVGLTSLWVIQRRKQIGIRRALGAKRNDIVRYFLLENAIISAVGASIGIFAAFVLNAALSSYTDIDPLPLWLPPLGAIVLISFGALATLGPALRAAQIPPAEATRSI